MVALAAPRAEVSFASRGILFGSCPFAFVVLFAPSTILTFFAATVAAERVIRTGRCSDAGTRWEAVRADAGFAFVLRTGTATASEGSVSASSSASESDATRFAAGVFRGCPGGAIACALAVAAAMCLLGVTGGTGPAEVTDVVTTVVVVSVKTSISSSVSLGGVTGVMRLFAVKTAACRSFRISSTAAHFVHSSCLRYMYCCCGPTTLPGRTMRIKAIASEAVKPYFQMRYAPISVPVRPRPALHCIKAGMLVVWGHSRQLYSRVPQRRHPSR